LNKPSPVQDICVVCGAYLRDSSIPCKECNGGVAHKKRNRGKVPWRNSEYASYERQRAAREGFGE
jgi:hypothetical protein